MRIHNKKLSVIVPLALCAALVMPGCGSSDSDTTSSTSEAVSESTSDVSAESTSEDSESEAPEIDGLTFENETERVYADKFHIYNYEDGYSLIDIPDSGEYLVVPEGEDVPENLDDDIVVLQQPLDNTYLAATSAMSLFDALDAVDTIKFSSLQASGWYVDSAVEALNNGDMAFAGKYSEPDYETLVDQGCTLAIESTMIYHTPKVKEMIEDLDIPVFVERSSYENHPLGRTEWIKVYATLVGKQEKAEEFFDEQVKEIEELQGYKNTEKTVAFFAVNSDGSVVIRHPSDYIAKMIDIAGGKYAFADLDTSEEGTTINITMEEFYATAKDADYLIYNAAIDSAITSIDDLIAKDSTFEDFKAVKNGNVWSTGKNLYQRTDIVGELIQDINKIVHDEADDDMTFLTKVN